MSAKVVATAKKVFKIRDVDVVKYAGGVMPRRELEKAAEESRKKAEARLKLQAEMDADRLRPLTEQEEKLALRARDYGARGLLRIHAFTSGMEPPENGVVCDEVVVLVADFLRVFKTSKVGIIPLAMPYVTPRLFDACARSKGNSSNSAAAK